MGDRGQTQQDFALGVSVLLLTIIGAFLFVQTGVFQTFDTSPGGATRAQADRVAASLVDHYATEHNQTVLRFNESGGINRSLDADPGLSTLAERAGLDVATTRRGNPNLNVTIINGSSLARGRDVPLERTNGFRMAWGPDPTGNENVVRSVRVIRLANDDNGQCDPVCWLLVRVW
ncbi:MAG: hypothetical protein ABEJ89_00780 [Haloarculaceae archaeon]